MQGAGPSGSSAPSGFRVPSPPPPPPVPVWPASIQEAATSRASDAGSVKDSASDAGSTATMDTSFSAGTLASAASTAFYPQVHFFSLDDFTGHDVHAILEDGEGEQDDPAELGRTEIGSQKSVRPGSIVSNIEQRLDEIEGFHGMLEAVENAAGSSSVRV